MFRNKKIFISYFIVTVIVLFILGNLKVEYAITKYNKIDENDSSNLEIDHFWDNFITEGNNFYEDEEDEHIYLRFIDEDITQKVDDLVNIYGVDVLFQGLESKNVYSQYYCINRLIEFYNDDDIRKKSLTKINTFLENENISIKDSAKFASSILSKDFDSKYILKANDDIKVFSLFNEYSEYGSYNELWMIKDDIMIRLHKFGEHQKYIDLGESMILSPEKDKIAVQTSSRRSSSINIINLNTLEVSPELVRKGLLEVIKLNRNYKNTYPNGEYSWGHGIKWLDNDSLKFKANLVYDYGETVESASFKYTLKDNGIIYEGE